MTGSQAAQSGLPETRTDRAGEAQQQVARKEHKPHWRTYCATRVFEHCPQEVLAAAGAVAGGVLAAPRVGGAGVLLPAGALAYWVQGRQARRRLSAYRLEALWAKACAKQGLYTFSRAGRTQLPDLRNVVIDHGNAYADIHLPPGLPFSRLAAAEETLEASFDRGRVQRLTIASDDNRRVGRLQLVRTVAFDRHNNEPWPYYPGAGIAIRQDYKPLFFEVGPEGPNILIAGIKGSGKSGWVNAIIAECIFQVAELWGIDLKMVELAPWQRRFSRMALDATRALQLLRDLRNEITRRSEWLKERGLRKWEPGCGLTCLVLFVDELRQLIVMAEGESKDEPKERQTLLASIQALGRAVGVQAVTATQNPRAAFVGEVRENSDVTICCRVRTATESFTAMGEVGRELRPDLITRRERGVAWVMGDDLPFKARALWLDDATIRALAA